MNKRSIYIVCFFVLFIGLIFQYNRVDGFLHLSTIRNLNMLSAYPIQADADMPELPRDMFLIIYDPKDVDSVLTRHIIETMLHDQKKGYIERTVYQEGDVGQDFQGVLICAGNFHASPDASKVLSYVQDGGTMVLFQHPPEAGLSAEYLRALGIAETHAVITDFGIDAKSDFLLGAKGFRMDDPKDYTTEATLVVRLLDSANTHITTASGNPLLWEHVYGNGKFYVYNGSTRDDKTNYGLYAALISHCGTESAYPVLASKVFFIDDFPAPIPEGIFEKIYDELHMTTEEFFRQAWWPYLLDMGKKYDVKYTGLIIETYAGEVHRPFRPLEGRAARDNAIVYGRELLAAGGELGIHGYNHQPLAPAGYNQDELGYNSWESYEDMVAAMTEVHRYVRSLYPDYDFRTYVPPSNILSPEGKAAIKDAFPEMKVYASLWGGDAEERAYYQDFKRNEDGTYELPRISSGHKTSIRQKWDIISGINYIGIISHFIHPDELFYDESKDLTWADMREGFEGLLSAVSKRYAWLDAMTASECAERLDDYTEFDYRIQRGKDKITLYSWNFRKPISYVFRTRHIIDHTENCTAEKIGEHAYRVRTDKSKAVIYWKEE